MRSSGGAIAIAVVQFLGSAPAFGMAALMLLLLANAPLVARLGTGRIAGAALVFAALAAWSIVTGVGLLRMRRWALASTLLFSAFLLAGGGGMVIGASAERMGPGLPARAAAVAAGVDRFLGIMLLGLAIWWILYLVRPNTRRAFSERLATAQPLTGAGPRVAAPRDPLDARPGWDPPGPQPGRLPFSLLVIVWMLLASSVAAILAAVCFRRADIVPLAGQVFRGAAAQWLMAGIAALTLVIGVGMLQLRAWARIAALVIFSFDIVNSFAMVLVPGALKRYFAAALAMRPALQQPSSFGAFVFGLALTTAGVLLCLYYLWTRKSAFEPAPLATPAEPEPTPAPDYR